MKLLMVGDVVGSPGRRMFMREVPRLRRELGLAAVVVNAENAAAGSGITAALAADFVAAGADAVTLCERPQYARDLKPLQTFQPKGTWTHATTFKDEIASDRLRWQIWTLRREG